MDWVIDFPTAEALLMQYSEWLDVENIQLTLEELGEDMPNFTHEQLVRKFLAERNPDARPKVWAEVSS